MKKTIYYMSLFIGLFICSSVLTACGDDDDDNGGSGGSKDNSDMRIIKIQMTDEDNKVKNKYFTYDEQGRVAEEEYDDHTITYTYGNSEITSTDLSIDRFGSTSTCNYTLSDGKIIKLNYDRDGVLVTYSYTYDTEGYLRSIKGTGEAYDGGPFQLKCFLTWSNGNLTHIIYKTRSYNFGEFFESKITYSNIPTPKNWITYYSYDNNILDKNLITQGFMGKKSIYLPSNSAGSAMLTAGEGEYWNNDQYSLLDDYNEDYGEPLEYEIKDGNVVKIIERWNDSHITTYDYTWGNYKVK